MTASKDPLGRPRTWEPKFCEPLFGDRFIEVEVFRSFAAWSPWFYDVAWDQTWIIIDKR
jgi:hypothetical protein